MAIFRSFLLGDVKNSVANVTMYLAKGVNVARAKPLSVNNPRTDKQKVQRAKMKLLAELSAGFGPALPLGFPNVKGLQHAANVFVKENMKWVTVNDAFEASIDFALLACSNGRLKQPIVSVEWSEESKKLAFTQTAQERTVTSNPTDEVVAVVYEKKQNEAEVFMLKTRGEDGLTNAVLPRDWSFLECKVYVFALNAKGTMASKTCCLE